jgi:hypothetical protein
MAKATGGVMPSKDFVRVKQMVRRPRPDAATMSALVEKWTAKLGKGEVACSCVSLYHRPCCKTLLPLQAWCLEEASLYEGILGPIAVGDGKTLMDLLVPMAVPNCKVAVLLVQANLRDQLLNVDWQYYGQHYHLPNFSEGRWFVEGRPILHVMSFGELSHHSSTDALTRKNPDLVVVDELQNLRDKDAARSKRFWRFMHKVRVARLCGWSGTIIKDSVRDFAPFSNAALDDNSPTPHSDIVIDEWAGALDVPKPGKAALGPGCLFEFCKAGENVQQGFRRRLEETRGVISSPDEGSCKAKLTVTRRGVHVPPEIQAKYDAVAASWERPDGELFMDALSMYRCLKEISCGFFYRWCWPRKEPLEVREKWKACRKAWHQEVREKLKRAKEKMDSPFLLEQAAHRWFNGYDYFEEKLIREWEEETQDGKFNRQETERVLIERVPPFSSKGPLPTWNATAYQDWQVVEPTAQPATEAIWESNFLIDDLRALEATTSPCIIWYEHSTVGQRVASHLGLRHYGGGSDASRDILGEDGTRSIVASIKAHGTGKNLQVFNKNIIITHPQDDLEQLLGRTHRQGQFAQEVTVHVYQHTQALAEFFQRSRDLARGAQDLLGGKRKLVIAEIIG